MYGTFDCDYQTTIGIDYLSKSLAVDERIVRFMMWDTAGQEKFRSLVSSYVRDSEVVIIMYDITRRKSFVTLDKWIDDARAHSPKNCLIYIVGGKSDMADERAVTVEEGENAAAAYNVKFKETSAKLNLGVTPLFKMIADDLYVRDNGIEPPDLTEVPLKLAPREASDAKKPASKCAC